MIPKVSIELLASTIASTHHDQEFATKQYKEIKDQNPVLFGLIEVVMKADHLSFDFKNGYCKAALQYYYLIKAQMECNELNDIPTT